MKHPINFLAWTGRAPLEVEIGAEYGKSADGVKLGAAVKVAFTSGANLSWANLSRSNLDNGEKITGSERPILQIGPIGSRSAYLVGYATDKGLMVRAGCFFGTISEFAKNVKATHGDNEYGREYAAAIRMMKSHAKIWEVKS